LSLAGNMVGVKHSSGFRVSAFHPSLDSSWIGRHWANTRLGVLVEEVFVCVSQSLMVYDRRGGWLEAMKVEAWKVFSVCCENLRSAITTPVD
jgi:hypothetical protein